MRIRHSAGLIAICCVGTFALGQSEQQLANWLKRFPAADANGDGKLTVEEARAFREKLLAGRKPNRRQGGAPRVFEVDPGWQAKRFPEHALCYRTPEQIAAALAETRAGRVVSYEKPQDGSLRIVGTGHSFMGPGYGTLPKIVAAAGFDQPPMLLHTGGGITGSTRYKWEQENGIFQFDKKPTPKLLASIANAEWDAMTWGPYFNDKPEYYVCWMDFCLKYNPEMRFYLSDAWPQLYQLGEVPNPEDFDAEVVTKMGEERQAGYAKLVKTLNDKYGEKVFIMPTCDAMVLAAQYHDRGELPGVEGLHKVVGGKERSLWRDHLGHLGPGFGQLEGYVFYATLYGRSPERIENDIRFTRDAYPSKELDRVFREIAWKAVTGNPLSGVKDQDGDGLAD